MRKFLKDIKKVNCSQGLRCLRGAAAASFSPERPALHEQQVLLTVLLLCCPFASWSESAAPPFATTQHPAHHSRALVPGFQTQQLEDAMVAAVVVPASSQNSTTSHVLLRTTVLSAHLRMGQHRSSLPVTIPHLAPLIVWVTSPSGAVAQASAHCGTARTAKQHVWQCIPFGHDLEAGLSVSFCNPRLQHCLLDKQICLDGMQVHVGMAQDCSQSVLSCHKHPPGVVCPAMTPTGTCGEWPTHCHHHSWQLAHPRVHIRVSVC